MEIKLTKITEGFYSLHTQTDIFLGTFETSEDGFFYFYENRNLTGCWGAWELRKIADLLDEVNKPYRDELNEYFKNENGYLIDNAF